MDKTNEIQRGKSSTGKMIAFGSPRFGSSVVLGIEGWALLTLYFVAYGLDPFRATFAQAMGYLAIAAAQFLLGWISDGKYTRWGRRKPYIIIFAPLLGISFIFLLLPGLVLPDLNDKNSLFLWLLVWDVLFRISYAVTTPYQAWMAEQFEVGDRPKVSQIQNYCNWIGNGLMSILTMLVFTGVFDKIAVDVNTIPMEFLLITVVFGVMVILLFYIVAFFMPTEPKYEIKTNLIENLKVIVKNKNYMLVVLMQGIAGLGLSMMTSVMLTYTEVVLNLGFMEYLIVAILLLVGIFLFLFIWRTLIQKKGKKSTILYIFLFGFISLPITLTGLIPMDISLIIGIIFILIVAFVLGGWFLFPYIMYADLAEDDERSTGDLKAGIYVGFPSIILNIFQAFGLLILGVILSLPNITVDGVTFTIGLVLWGPLCSVIFIITYLYIRKFVILDFDWEKK